MAVARFVGEGVFARGEREFEFAESSEAALFVERNIGTVEQTERKTVARQVQPRNVDFEVVLFAQVDAQRIELARNVVRVVDSPGLVGYLRDYFAAYAPDRTDVS